MDVVVWLRSLGLGRYEAAFRENEIADASILIRHGGVYGLFLTGAVVSWHSAGPATSTPSESGMLCGGA